MYTLPMIISDVCKVRFEGGSPRLVVAGDGTARHAQDTISGSPLNAKKFARTLCAYTYTRLKEAGQDAPGDRAPWPGENPRYAGIFPDA